MFLDVGQHGRLSRSTLPSEARTLRDIGFRGVLSLELVNAEYWNQDALLVARTGQDKIRAAVKRALG